MKRVSLVAAAAASFLIAGLDAAEAETVPERLIQDLQQDFEFTDFQAAGVAGNLARETGNFRYMQEINPVVEGSRGGVGYSQWTASRRVAFEAWAAEQGHEDLMSYETNYGYLSEELNGRYARVVRKVRETETVEDAARVFMKLYLVPHPSYTHLDERISYAEAFLAGDFSGAGCQKQHEIYHQDDMIILKMCEPADEEFVLATDFEALGDLSESIQLLTSISELKRLGVVGVTVSEATLTYGESSPTGVVDDPFIETASARLSFQREAETSRDQGVGI